MNPEENPNETKTAEIFVQQTFPMGAEQLFPWDKALATCDAIEEEELSRLS